MDGHAIANLEHCKDLAHCQCGIRTGEPADQCILNGDGSGACRQLLGHGAQCAEDVTGDAHQAFQGDLHGADGCSQGGFQCIIDSNGDFLFDIRSQELCSLGEIGCVTCSEIFLYQRIVCQIGFRTPSVCIHVVCSTVGICLLSKLDCTLVVIEAILVSLFIVHIATNLIQGNSRQSLSQDSLADHGSQSLIVSLDGTSANGCTGQTVVVCGPAFVIQIVKDLDNEFRLGLCCVVELCFFPLADSLLHSGQTCDVGIQRIKQDINDIADGNGVKAFAGDDHTVGGIHQANQNDLNIGVQSNDSLQSAFVVQQEADTDVCHHVDQILNIDGAQFSGDIIRCLCHHLVVCIHDGCLLLGLQNGQCCFQVDLLVLIQRTAHDTHHTGEVLNHVCTESSITNTHGDDICIGNSFLVDALQSIAGSAGIVLDLAEPAVGGHLTATQQVVQILSTHSRNCQLVVLHGLAGILLCQIGCKIIGVCSIAVYALADQELLSTNAALVITSKAITIGHRVAQRNVVDHFVALSSECSDGAGRDQQAQSQQHCQTGTPHLGNSFHMFSS